MIFFSVVTIDDDDDDSSISFCRDDDMDVVVVESVGNDCLSFVIFIVVLLVLVWFSFFVPTKSSSLFSVSVQRVLMAPVQFIALELGLSLLLLLGVAESSPFKMVDDV